MKKLTLIIAALLLAFCPFTAVGQTPNSEEMWRTIQQQANELEKLRAEVAALKTQQSTTDDVLDQVVEKTESTDFGGASHLGSDVQIGGYGEMHYNTLNGDGGGSDKDQIDYHRFVLFIGHEFTEGIRFFSEIELEHSLAGDGKPGEVELEQAYIDFDLSESHTARGGLFLIPVGILNETHEPNTFYGTERNNVEKNIIPTTWWAGGVALHGELAEGLQYDLAYTSGLAVEDDYKIRGGRQKVAEGAADSGAVTGRLRLTRPGFVVGATLQHQNDLTQNGANGAPEKAAATLYEGHVVFEKGSFGLRALYAHWDVDADAAEALGRDQQEGWYIEPSLRLNEKLGVFARYSEWDNEAGNSIDTEYDQIDFGINIWPHENIVLKADYQMQEKGTGAEVDGLNLAIGFSF